MPVESLYTPYLIEAGKDKRYIGTFDEGNVVSKEGNNPLCGDKITWHLKRLPENKIQLHFETSGCLISRASASFLASLMQGKTEVEFAEYLTILKEITTANADTPTSEQLDSTPWLSLAQIKEYPTRKKCVFLAWETLASLLESLE